MYSICKLVNVDPKSPRALSSYIVILHLPTGRIVQANLIVEAGRVIKSDYNDPPNRWTFERVYSEVNEFARKVPFRNALVCRENVSVRDVIALVTSEIVAITPPGHMSVVMNAARNFHSRLKKSFAKT